MATKLYENANFQHEVNPEWTPEHENEEYMQEDSFWKFCHTSCIGTLSVGGGGGGGGSGYSSDQSVILNYNPNEDVNMAYNILNNPSNSGLSETDMKNMMANELHNQNPDWSDQEITDRVNAAFNAVNNLSNNPDVTWNDTVGS